MCCKNWLFKRLKEQAKDFQIHDKNSIFPEKYEKKK